MSYLDLAKQAEIQYRSDAYRDAVLAVWRLMAQGNAADPAECTSALDEVARRLDDVGEPRATVLRREWARAWHDASGRCPYCGEPGDLHDVEAGA